MFGNDRHVCAVSLMGAHGEGMDRPRSGDPGGRRSDCRRHSRQNAPGHDRGRGRPSAFPRFREVAAAAYDLGRAPGSKRGRSRGRCVRRPALRRADDGAPHGTPSRQYRRFRPRD